MGMLKIDTWGSFKPETFRTSAEEGGHVMALKRGIKHLADQLGDAVIQDAKLTLQGEKPPRSLLGKDV